MSVTSSELETTKKFALHCGKGLKHACDFERVQLTVETEPPNLSLYKFKGVVHYTSYASESDTVGQEASEPVSQDNMLLRGTMLRNTKWALCIVVATGTDTKIVMNSGVTPTKKSRISSQLNLSILFNFGILFILCFISGLINGLFYHKKHNSFKAFEYKPYAGWSSAANGIVSFFAALILYQTLVPISFYVSIEIIRTVQAFFIFADAKMYYKKLDFSCTPKSWNISDDLGQIEYIFSDKTGTLTQNVMEFKKCTIAGKQYGITYTEAQQGMDKRNGINVVAKAEEMKHKIDTERLQMNDQLTPLNNDQYREGKLTFISNEYVSDTVNGHDPRRKAINEEFMKALALCHTVITETDHHGFLQFKAESPDEAALVQVARDVGIVFRERTSKGQLITMYDPEKPLLYETLDLIPFNSTRKRMSIIFKTPEGKIVLYCKGADNIIYERLDKHSDEQLLSQTAIHLGEFAQEGLRTLCIAYKEIDPVFFDDWHARYRKAMASVSDDRDAELDSIGEEIETGLTLIGGTAIEDKLQDGVPQSISLLRKAGIKLWVLTGDKVETAINIGFSCNLLDNSMELLVIQNSQDDDADENASAKDLVEKFLSEKFGMSGSPKEIEHAKGDHSVPTSDTAIIVDGFSLTTIFKDHDLTMKFLLLCKQCKSVLCCRVTPAQKADIVKMVKNTLNVMTLAIGDGANDVSMIQCANVGVGIAGEEGRQAVMSSDYAIGQFRYLTRLLLVHGKWDYKRLAEMVPCFFYKNVNFVMVLFFYGIFCNFDGTYMYEFTYLMCYNLFFTSVPIIIMAILDQDVSDVVSLAVPQLYRTGVLGTEWSQYKFFYYMLDDSGSVSMPPTFPSLPLICTS
ncbi:unnamed protein product [Ambrosiozyma monospora]|uniref:Unnamed protein product n=1 Tax=Ambrosiozyma monospora TaxID=43982 RepID=A0ACB5T9F1_AMBMO|nr:unnamed protein product [Ambrosiozyma monospora]